MRYDEISPVPPLTAVTKFLILTCVGVYLVDFVLFHLGFQVGGLNLSEILGLVPYYVRERLWFWQFFTYMFMHGHPLHLLLNMLILWYFGAELELRLGKIRFTKYYLTCGVGAGIFNVLVNFLIGNESRLSHPIIGASGAIFGILAAYGIFFADRYFLVFFVFPMKAKYFVLVMAAMELIMGVEANARDNVAHFAHLGGMVIGAIYVFVAYVRPRGGKGQRKKDWEKEKLKKQFTLIVNESQKSQKDNGPYWN